MLSCLLRNLGPLLNRRDTWRQKIMVPHTYSQVGKSTAPLERSWWFAVTAPDGIFQVVQLCYQYILVSCGILPCVYDLYCSLIVTLLKSALYGQLWEGLNVALRGSGSWWVWEDDTVVGCDLPNKLHSLNHPTWHSCVTVL